MHERDQEHFPHFDATHLEEIGTQVLLESLHLFLRHLPFALLSSPDNDVILAMVGYHSREVDVLVLARHVPRLHVDVELSLAVLRGNRLWQSLLVLLKELKGLIDGLKFDGPLFIASQLHFQHLTLLLVSHRLDNFIHCGGTFHTDLQGARGAP